MKPLRKLRLEADPPIPSARALAAKAGINERVVQHVENGERPLSDGAAIALSSALGITPLALREALDAENDQAPVEPTQAAA